MDSAEVPLKEQSKAEIIKHINNDLYDDFIIYFDKYMNEAFLKNMMHEFANLFIDIQKAVLIIGEKVLHNKRQKEYILNIYDKTAEIKKHTDFAKNISPKQLTYEEFVEYINGFKEDAYFLKMTITVLDLECLEYKKKKLALSEEYLKLREKINYVSKIYDKSLGHAPAREKAIIEESDHKEDTVSTEFLSDFKTLSIADIKEEEIECVKPVKTKKTKKTILNMLEPTTILDVNEPTLEESVPISEPSIKLEKKPKRESKKKVDREIFEPTTIVDVKTLEPVKIEPPKRESKKKALLKSTETVLTKAQEESDTEEIPLKSVETKTKSKRVTKTD